LKKYLLISMLVAACCPALATDAPAAKPPAGKLPPEVQLALEALQKEYDARLNPPKGQPVRLDQPSAAGYSEAQKAALRAVFGTEDALDIKRLPAKGRLGQYTVRFPAHAYDYAGTHSEWSAAALQVTVNGNGTSSTGTWPGIEVRGQDFKFSAHDLTISERQGRDAATGLKLGGARLNLARIEVHDNSGPVATEVQGENTTVQVAVGKQGKKIEEKFDILTKRLTAGGVRVDDIHFAFRVRDMDSAALKKFEEAIKNRKASYLPEEERGAAALADMGQMFKTQVLQGASLEISDIGASYGGHRFQMKGSVSMAGATEQDLSSAAAILNKLQARIEIKLPQPMLRSIAHGFAQIANKGEPGDPEMENNMYQLFLGKALSEGYARLEKDVLVSVLELKNGKLRINGKEQAFSVADLLQQLDKHAPPPPEDHSVPVELTWSDRKLENVQLFAGNGLPRAIWELCYRHTSGDGAAKDSEEALKWCGINEELAPKEPAEVPREAAPPGDARTIRYRTKAGFYDTNFYRFDENQSRTLEVTLENPKENDDWLPAATLCLTAEAPSDVACLSLSRVGKEKSQLQAAVSLLPTDGKSRKNGQKLGHTLPLGEPVHLKAYVRNGKAYFAVNDEELEQEIVFPVELMQLFCSTGDCTFKFD
jgi:hypothetical protein